MTNQMQQSSKACPRCGQPMPAQAPEALCPACLMKQALAAQTEEIGDGQSAGTRVSRNPPPEPLAPEKIAASFPQLEILECLGRGGMGVVYKARQPRLNRLVALKILAPEKEKDTAFAERFTREAQALARLNHPNIVTVYDFGEAGGLYYLLMEYVDGLNLRQLLQTRKVKPEEALVIVPKICEALQFAHEQGVVHRDVKPENVLVDPQGRVKIADFGIAKIVGAAPDQRILTGDQQVIGTPHYMAPEQMEHPQLVDHRADIYSLGVVFYEMLTGELPIGKFALPSQKVSVDVRLDEIVLHALEKERDRRYQHASQVKTDVESVTAAPPRSQPAASRPASPEQIEYETARRAARGPAIGLLVTGILNWVLIPLYLLVGFYFVSHSGSQTGWGAMITALLMIMAASSFMIYASFKMKALEARAVALAGSILAIVISPGNLLGLPIGIWALAVLTRPQVRRMFGQKPPVPLEAPVQPPLSPADKSRRFFFTTASVFLIGAAVFVVLIVVLMLSAILLPALSRARSAARNIAATQLQREATAAWLKPAIEERLQTYSVEFDNLNVAFSPSFNSGTCTFGGLRALKGEQGLKVWSPISGELRLESSHPSSWRVRGTRDLGQVEFSVEAPPATRLIAFKDQTLVRAFAITNQTISTNLLATNGAWLTDCRQPQVLRLFDLEDPGLEKAFVIFRAMIKTEDFQGRVYPEMLCRLPGHEEPFFSRGLDNPIVGSSEWTPLQTPFTLKAGDRPDLINLNVVVEGQGKVWIKDVELFKTPLVE